MDRKTFDLQMDRLLEDAAAQIPLQALPSLPCMKGFPDIPEWHPHELILWSIGESIRQLTATARQSFNDHQIDAILRICQNKHAGRGRQSFVMLLGKRRYSGFAESIISLLQDSDVEGHVIHALYKMNAPGYADRIHPFLTHNQAWVRREAQRYLQKFNEKNGSN